MKALRVLLVAALVAGLTFHTVHAKQGGPGKGHKKSTAERVEKITKKLSLSAEQQQQLTSILNEQENQLASLTAQMKQLREQMRSLRTEQKSKIQAILTPEQLTKYEEKKAKKGMKQGKKKGHKKHKKNRQ